MDRIKVNLPNEFRFSTKINIRITDVNYGGHVGNDSFLALIHEARLQFLQHFGYSEVAIENVALIMVDAAIEFKAELFYKDEVIISVAAANFTNTGFNLFYKIEKENKIAAKAKTGMLCFNYDTRKVAQVPQQFIDKMKEL